MNQLFQFTWLNFTKKRFQFYWRIIASLFFSRTWYLSSLIYLCLWNECVSILEVGAPTVPFFVTLYHLKTHHILCDPAKVINQVLWPKESAIMSLRYLVSKLFSRLGKSCEFCFRFSSMHITILAQPHLHLERYTVSNWMCIRRLGYTKIIGDKKKRIWKLRDRKLNESFSEITGTLCNRLFRFVAGGCSGRTTTESIPQEFQKSPKGFLKAC